MKVETARKAARLVEQSDELENMLRSTECLFEIHCLNHQFRHGINAFMSKGIYDGLDAARTLFIGAIHKEINRVKEQIEKL